MDKNEEMTFITDPRMQGQTMEKKKTTFTPTSIPQPRQQLQKHVPASTIRDEDKEFDPVERERYWDLIWKRISFCPTFKHGDQIIVNNEFYQKPEYLDIRPSIDLWQAIVRAQRISNIQINIPDTLINYNDTQYLLYTNPETGCLSKKPEASFQEFEKKICDDNIRLADKFYQESPHLSHRRFNAQHTMLEVYELLNHKENPEVPFMISRHKGKCDWLGSTLVLPYSKREEKKANLESTEILQKYIFSKPLKATILRLQFYTKNAKSMSANFGYRIMNRMGNFDSKQTKRNLEQKSTTILDSDKDNDNYNCKVWPGKTINEFSIEVQLVKGVGLKEYERQTEQLVKLLERNNKVRISEIVCDFIQDTNGQIWFINCRSIKLESTKSMQDLLSQNKQDDGDDGKGTLAQLTCSVYCKLCGIKFKKDEASKVLTYKLLWELVQHLKKRNINLKNIKVSHKTTRPCRVCNLCYMLVVGEHELIEIEQQFAIAQNIPITDNAQNNKKHKQAQELNDAVIRVPIDQKPKHRPALLSEQLYQWRIIFYIIEISNIGTEHNIDFNNLYLQFKLNKFQTCFKVDPNQQDASQTNNNMQHSQTTANLTRAKSANRDGRRGSTSQQDYQEQLLKHKQAKETLSTVSVNKIKVQYIFSEEIDISKFLNETEIKVRLTQGPDWNSFLAEGSSKTIHHFKNKIEGGQRHSSQVLLFFENSKYCVLTLNVGLVCDKQYNTAKLNLYKYNNIYFPDENYYNSNPFPSEWCEMFDPQFESEKDYLDDNKGTEKYSPKCSQADLNKMIDFNSYKSKSKFKHVPSKVSQMIRINSAKTADSGFIKGLQNDVSKNYLSPSAGDQTTAAMFPSTTKSIGVNSKPPRAQTAQFFGKRNQSEANLKRPMSNKLQPLNNNKSEVPPQHSNKKSESYRFLLEKNKSKNQAQQDDKEILVQYKEFDNLFSDDEGEENLDDSAEEVIRDKLMQHFKKVNKIDEENEDIIVQRRTQSGVPQQQYNFSDNQPPKEPVNKDEFSNYLNKKKQTIETQN